MKKAIKRKKDPATPARNGPPRNAPYIPRRVIRVAVEGVETDHDESMSGVEDEEEDPTEDQTQGSNDEESNSNEGMVSQEREEAIADEEPVLEPEGAALKDNVAPKVPHYWEPRTPKDRPVCRVKPMPRPPKAPVRPVNVPVVPPVVVPPVVVPPVALQPLVVPPVIVLD